MEATLDQAFDGAAAQPRRDRRLHTSTVRVVLTGLAIVAFLFTFSFTRAWGERVDRLSAQSSTDVFKTIDLETLNGDHFTADNVSQARITVFNVWGTSCPPCIAELPELEALNHSYEPGQVQVVGILNDSITAEGQVDEGHLEAAQMYMEKAGATFPTLILDEPTYAFVKTNIIGTPTTFIVDSEGNIVKTVTGGNNLESWKTIVDEVLAGLPA